MNSSYKFLLKDTKALLEDALDDASNELDETVNSEEDDVNTPDESGNEDSSDPTMDDVQDGDPTDESESLDSEQPLEDEFQQEEEPVDEATGLKKLKLFDDYNDFFNSGQQMIEVFNSLASVTDGKEYKSINNYKEVLVEILEHMEYVMTDRFVKEDYEKLLILFISFRNSIENTSKILESFKKNNSNKDDN